LVFGVLFFFLFWFGFYHFSLGAGVKKIDAN